MSLLPLEEARQKVLEALTPLGLEEVSLTQALARVSGADLIARTTQPPQNVSAMDGYALQSASDSALPFRLQVIGESQAGGGFDGFVGEGQAVRIFTGAPLPGGADCVIMQEDCERDGDRVLIKEKPFAGKYVREKGYDFAAGNVLIAKGTLLSARHIGLMAAMDIPWLKVYRKPVVGILATGDELVMPGEARTQAQIVSSNSLMICALVEALGGVPVNLGIARDTENSLADMIAGIGGLDMLVTCGGVSVGEYDLVQKVLAQAGMDVNFYKIAMRPGKPFMFGQLGNCPVMGLPGNPVSAYVTAHTFLRPALMALQGMEVQEDRTLKAELKTPLKANSSRFDFMRTRLLHQAQGRLVAEPLNAQDSSLLSRLAACDGFILRPPHDPAREEGALVDVLPIDQSVYSV